MSDFNQIKKFTLPPSKIMYTVFKEPVVNVHFTDIRNKKDFKTFSDAEKNLLRKCLIQYAYRTIMQAVREALGKKAENLTDKEIRLRFPNYKKYVFVLKTDTYLVVKKIKEQYILIDRVRNRSSEIFKTCTLCGGLHYRKWFVHGKGGRCYKCRTRILHDKKIIRVHLLKSSEKETSTIKLFGKHTWDIDVSEQTVRKLEKYGIVVRSNDTVHMLYDYYDLEQKGLDINKILQD